MGNFTTREENFIRYYTLHKLIGVKTLFKYNKCFDITEQLAKTLKRVNDLKTHPIKPHDRYIKFCENDHKYFKLLFDKFGTDNKSITEYVLNIITQSGKKIDYKKMPRNERKDNGNYPNFGGSNGNGNKIRVPKKIRKNAWKKFKKLFPHYIEK